MFTLIYLYGGQASGNMQVELKNFHILILQIKFFSKFLENKYSNLKMTKPSEDLAWTAKSEFYNPTY